MNLEMYLSKKTYVGNQYRDPQNRVEIILPENEVDEPFSIKKGSIKTERVSEIIELVGYWRKADAIHQWFVDNVQDGEDDCGEYYVSKDKIKELYNLCKEVIDKAVIIGNDKEVIIKNKDEIIDLLPSYRESFFGSSNYAKWYIAYIKATTSILEPLLEEDGDFYYSSI